MADIIYVSSNNGKHIDVKDKFERAGLHIDYYVYDFEEPEVNDIEIISREKAKMAYELLKKPCIVEDSGFYIDNYPNSPGYPGALVKRSGIAKNVKGLLETMIGVNNRSCKFLTCLTFYDGKDFYQFFWENRGTLATEKRGVESIRVKSNLWYVFIPENCDKTLAEMSNYEFINRKDNRTSATDLFIEWYRNYLLDEKNKVLNKKDNSVKS